MPLDFLDVDQQSESQQHSFKKTKEYYQDVDVTMDDLENIEQRVEELEKYLGVSHVEGNLQYFVSNDIEKLD